jgi:hypothetical protein
VDSIAHLTETYSKQHHYLRADILIWLIIRLSVPYNNIRHSQSIFQLSKSEKTSICQNIPLSYTKSRWVLLEHIQSSDNWSIWKLLHFDQDLLGILDSQTQHPWFRTRCACISNFLIPFSKTCICINTYTPLLIKHLSELKPKYRRSSTKTFLITKIRTICS